jgi:hypothetical protein
MIPTSEIQLKARSLVIETREGHALTFGYKLGPITFFIIANIPDTIAKDEKTSVYIKINLRIGDDWQYSTESKK